MYAMKELPETERPRERLRAAGPSALSEAELLAILIRTGTRGVNAVELSHRVLKEVELSDASSVSMNRLKSIDGLGEVKAGQVVAVVELARRIVSKGRDGSRIRKPEEVYEEVRHDLDPRRECFVGLYLDTKAGLLRKERVSIGSLNRSIVHPREVLRPGVLDGAASVIVAHNHPSGDPSPSEGDIEVTRRLEAASEIVGIELLDHVVVGEGSYVSLAEEGLIGSER